MISNMEWLECCVRVTILCKNWQDIRAHQLGLLSTFDDWVEIDWLPRRWWMCNSSSSESILHKIRIPSPVMDISMSNYRYREPCDLTKAHTYSTWRQHEIEKLFSLCFFYIFFILFADENEEIELNLIWKVEVRATNESWREWMTCSSTCGTQSSSALSTFGLTNTQLFWKLTWF